MDSRFDCETQAEVLVCATPEGVDTAVFAKPRGDGEVSVEGQRELSLRVCDAADEDFVSETSEEAERVDEDMEKMGGGGLTERMGPRGSCFGGEVLDGGAKIGNRKIGVGEECVDDVSGAVGAEISEQCTENKASNGDWRFSSLGWFFSSLSIVWTDALVEMCGGCGICDVETLFNCLPDDVEQWPGALRLLCDMFVPASRAPVLETKKHGVHVAEFYAKMLDYGAEVSKNKNKKKKGVKRKGREEEEDAAAAKRVRAKAPLKRELYRLANGVDGLSVLKDLFSSEHFEVHVVQKEAKFAVGDSSATVVTENLYYFCDSGGVPSAKSGGFTLARVGSGRKDKIEYFPGRATEYVSNVAGETLSGRKHKKADSSPEPPPSDERMNE